MKVMVYGLGHLGCVTAAGLASVGHDVVALDQDKGAAELPDEPGLGEMVMKAVGDGKLEFVGSLPIEPLTVDVLWVTFDTPVDADDQAAVDQVLDKIHAIMPFVPYEVPILISCQLPVGTVHHLGLSYPEHRFACLPENLRHGKALQVFLHPDRVVVGCRDGVRGAIIRLLAPITDRIEWMTIESAEMTKHAINAWMAMSICYANEIAAICKKVGAHPAEVERGLRTEERIGKKAYIRPGGPYTGKTLARDLEYLQRMRGEIETPLLSSIKPSNEAHKGRGNA